MMFLMFCFSLQASIKDLKYFFNNPPPHTHTHNNFRSAIMILGSYFLESLHMPVSSTDYLHNLLGKYNLQSFISCDWAI